ncbi:MAG: LPS-assembly protein LptD, partial [Paracoccaceae bacterium]
MRILIFFLILLIPLFARAEAPANLSADSILYNEKSGDIEASGNVVVVKDHLTLYTNKLIYDASTDSIVVPEKLRLYDNIKKEETHGSYGELSSDLRNGILKSARIIQQQQLQITAGKLEQQEGRYTVLNKAVTSYCKVCKEDSTPIWEIRSRKVVKDNVKEIIIFEDAIFRVLGFPVFYTPYLHIPHSQIKRASGFLKPSYIYDNKNGLKIFTPYFITLGDHADILLTPWIKSEGVDTVEVRFREKLHFGDLNITHSSTIEKQSKYRWFLFMNADIPELPYGFKGSLNLKKTSDATYRSEYGFGSEDRLRNSFSANRTNKKQHIETNFIHYETLRTTESNSTMPNTIVDAEYNKRFAPETLGGVLDIKIDTRGNYRTQSNKNETDGSSRDVVRLSSMVNWQKDWNIGNGIIAGIGSQIRSDSYKVYQDPSANDIHSFNPSGSIGIKWPIISKKEKNTHFIEPKIQFISSDNGRNLIPNEDSLLPEFDETNLFEFSRFPGVDTYEKGQRVNLGINYTFERLKSFKTIFKIGKVLRNRNENYRISHAFMDVS